MISMQVEYNDIMKMDNGRSMAVKDCLAVEEPLEIQLEYSTSTGRMKKNIAVTMRTPGNDAALAAGFLFSEGIINDPQSIKSIHPVYADPNRILVTLHESIMPYLNNADRNFYSTSSCGICGKASIEAVYLLSCQYRTPDTIRLHHSLFYILPEILNKNQEVFNNTGSIHASALFNLQAELILMQEDIGRHNALDKLIGSAFMDGLLPLNNHILLLSGRASFELVQKAVMAGIKIIVAVGAPSSLAAEMAQESGVTLVGFLRNQRFNIYTGAQRIIID